MGGLFGGGGGSETKLAGVQVQTSLLGEPIVFGYGRARVSCNLIDYVGFKATEQQQGGKGGGGYKSYTYSASVIMALCEGPIGGVRSVYKDSSTFTGGSALSQAGVSLATGTLTQSPWGYMVSMFPSHALGYSTIAYVYAQDYELGSGASLSNHGFEVDFAIQFGPNGDAVAADIATDFLTNASYGVTGWTTGLTGSWTNWSDYTKAANLLLSPVVDSSGAGADFLKRLSDQTNTEFVWSEGVLKAKPLGDATVTANSVTWTPDLTPVYDLTEDDFLGEVQLEIADQSDAKNYVQVEFLDRANQYQPAIQVAQDLDDIVTYGLRKGDVVQMHDICDAGIAQTAAQLLLQRSLYIRDRFVFHLPEDFVLLEPTDLVTLTTTVDGMQLNRRLVRIEEINEDETGEFEIVAREVPGQTASAAAYASHSSAGYQPNPDVAPGSVTSPVLFIPPAGLLGIDGEAWLAAGSNNPNWGGCQVWVSADGVSYQQIGTIATAARYGTLTAALPSAADPDNTNTLAVDLTNSAGTLASVTAAQMNAGGSLSLVDNELVGYQTATLTAANKYDLTPLRRGLYGTALAAHSIGGRYVRLDDAIFKIKYKSLNVGNTLYVKLPSFNLYGRALEDISTVSAYTVSLANLPTLTNDSMPPGYVSALIASSYVVDADPLDGLLQAMPTSINVETHTRVYSDKTVSVTGTTLTTEDDGTTAIAASTLYHVYYDDAGRAGGGVSLKATRTSSNAANGASAPYRHYVGSISTPATGVTTPVTGGGAVPGGWRYTDFR